MVRLVAAGRRNADIAEQLFVGVDTVKTHLAHAYAKVDVSTRAELAAEAARRLHREPASTVSRVDPKVQQAVSNSHLRGVPTDVLGELTAGARPIVIRGGAVFHWEGDHVNHLELVVSGLVRALVSAPDGRTMTIRYARPGALLGAMSLFSDEFSMPGSVQALVETRLLRLQPDVVRRMARQSEVAHALMLELSERARGFLLEITEGAFGSVRQRLTRHLLDLADPRRDVAGDASSEFVVQASQQELADATGTVREVIVRTLRELREEGLVRTGRGEIVLVDASRLLDTATGT